MKTLLLIAATLSLAASARAAYLTPQAAADRVTSLPGWSGSTEGMHAGYVTVDAHKGRSLYYFFVESRTSPAQDPLVLWLNGGPGCSSIGGGLMTELGPFFPSDDGESLVPNEYTWTKVANVIFVDSPAGVGYSYSNDTSDYTVGDARTSADLYLPVFLQGFLQRYPQYANSPFWVSGESYGGHYVPNLAHYIHQQNQADVQPHINLQGFLVGNAWTDPESDNLGAVQQWWSHAMISDQTYQGMQAVCNFTTVGPLAVRAEARTMLLRSSAAGQEEPQQCDTLQQVAMQEMGDVFIYHMYADSCHTQAAQQGAVLHAMARRHLPAALRAGPVEPAGGVAGYNPCVLDAVGKYLNKVGVREAMHARDLGYHWDLCSPRVNYSRQDLLTPMLHTYRDLLGAGLRMLVFSGDMDGIVATPGTRLWLNKLPLREKSAWRSYTVDRQVGGYVTEFQDGLTFATVRGAGHMVPYTQPSRALHMFSRFVAGQPL